MEVPMIVDTRKLNQSLTRERYVITDLAQEAIVNIIPVVMRRRVYSYSNLISTSVKKEMPKLYDILEYDHSINQWFIVEELAC